MTDSANWLRPLASRHSTRQSGLRALSVVGASQVIKLLLNITGTLVLMRLLSPEEFGIAAMSAVLVNFIFMFKDLGLGTVTAQSANLTQEEVSSIFWLAQIVGALFVIIGIFSSPIIALFFNNYLIADALTLLSLGFILSTLGSQHAALLSRRLRFSVLGAIEIIAVISGLSLAVVMALFDWGWWSLVWQRLAQMLVSTAGLWLACSWRPSVAFNYSSVRTRIALGMHISGANVAGYVSRNADNALVGWYWGATALGYYAKAYDLLMAPIAQIAVPLGQVLQPIFAQSRNNPGRYLTSLTMAITASLLALMPVGSMMIWQPVMVTRVVFGDAWLAAAPMVGWFGLSVCVGLVGSVLTWSLISRHRGRDLSRVAWINAVINLVGFLLSVSYGIDAVAATYVLIGFFIRTPYLFWVVTDDELLPRREVIRAIYLPSIAFAVVSLVNFAVVSADGVFPSHSWGALLAQLVIGYLVMAAVVLPTKFGRRILRSARARNP